MPQPDVIMTSIAAALTQCMMRNARGCRRRGVIGDALLDQAILRVGFFENDSGIVRPPDQRGRKSRMAAAISSAFPKRLRGGAEGKTGASLQRRLLPAPAAAELLRPSMRYNRGPRTTILSDNPL